MSLKMYQLLILPCSHKVSEASAPYQFLTERHLHAMWLEQKYFKQLNTVHGEPIEVISPGIWNAEAGPDFLKAHLKIGSEDYFGDIEIHLSEEAWYQHQHHIDERYDNVILHLSLWEAQNPITILKKNQQKVSQAYLEKNLSISHSRIIKLIDLDLYPYKKFLGSGKCAHALFKTLSDHKIHSFFSSAASWRLQQKHNFLSSWGGDDASTQFAAGFSRVLGYKQNAQAFLEIFHWLHKLPLQTTQKYLALAMQASGYFSDDYQKKWNASEYYLTLLATAKNNFKNFPNVTLQLNQIRPLNHPLRRLFILSYFLHENLWSSLLKRLYSVWDDNWKNCQTKKELRILLKALQEVLPTLEDPHWSFHFTFENTAHKDPLPLMGKELRTNVLINVFLPFLHEKIQKRGQQEELQKFQELFYSIPALKSGKSRYLIHRFFGNTDKGKILKSAQMEQGAYQLHHDFCLHYEASCEGCPFVERYNQSFK